MVCAIPEVIGTAFSLNMFFKIPVWCGMLITRLSTLTLLILQQSGVSKMKKEMKKVMKTLTLLKKILGLLIGALLLIFFILDLLIGALAYLKLIYINCCNQYLNNLYHVATIIAIDQ